MKEVPDTRLTPNQMRQRSQELPEHRENDSLAQSSNGIGKSTGGEGPEGVLLLNAIQKNQSPVMAVGNGEEGFNQDIIFEDGEVNTIIQFLMGNAGSLEAEGKIEKTSTIALANKSDLCGNKLLQTYWFLQITELRQKK